MLKKTTLLVFITICGIHLSMATSFASSADFNQKDGTRGTATEHALKSCTGTGAKALTGALGEGCINSTEFFINTDSLTPGGKSKLLSGEEQLDGSTDKTVNRVLGNLIQKMITVMGVIALFIMTIGGGYMIFHMGEESLLSRGKTIFMWGLISLVVALSAGILVQLITYLLY